jgi:hypothetical protein
MPHSRYTVFLQQVQREVGIAFVANGRVVENLKIGAATGHRREP